MELMHFMGTEVGTERIIVGTAPDGTTVSVDLDHDDGTVCPVYGGPGGYGCTLDFSHGGKWHIADDGVQIIGVWPV